jgi:hypothetical protein
MQTTSIHKIIYTSAVEEYIIDIQLQLIQHECKIYGYAFSMQLHKHARTFVTLGVPADRQTRGATCVTFLTTFKLYLKLESSLCETGKVRVGISLPF